MIISLKEKIIQIQVSGGTIYCLTSAGNIYAKHDNFNDFVLIAKSTDMKVIIPLEKERNVFN